MIVELADKLLDRSIQFINHRKQNRKTKLENYVKPIYELFEELHSAYLESFSKYRDMVQNAQEDELQSDSNIIKMIQRDNLFTAHQRGKVFELAKAAEDEDVGKFMQAIYDYLLSSRFISQREIQEHTGVGFIQRWRSSLISELSSIFSENWRSTIDPNISGPPLSDDDLQYELEQKCKEFKIEPGDEWRIEKLKRGFAFEALDGIVGEMQREYQEVNSKYLEVKKSLE